MEIRFRCGKVVFDLNEWTVPVMRETYHMLSISSENGKVIINDMDDFFDCVLALKEYMRGGKNE